MTEIPGHTLSQADLTELEIAAFMGPHVKRARFALVLVGIMYALTAYLHYGDIAAAHRAMGAYGDDPEVAAMRQTIDAAYYFIVFTGIAGVANILLAAIGGKRPTFAMYTAVAIFVAHSLFQLYLGMAPFADWVWWISAIVVGMGGEAAWKAEKLRRERREQIPQAIART